MSDEKTAGTIREAVAVMEDWSSLEHAVDALLEAGFEKDDISMVAGHATVEAKMGHMYERVEDIEDDPEAPRTAFVSARDIGTREDMVVSAMTIFPTLFAGGVVVASTGPLAAILTGTALAGAAIGTVLSRWIDRRHSDWLQEQIDRGGILLWVRTKDEMAERVALRTLMRFSAHDVHIHDMPRRH